MNQAIPRLELEQMAPTLRTALEPRVARLRYLGEFFRCMAHQPDALLGFMQFTESAKSGLDQRTVETIALTVAALKGNDYERNQHERLAVRLGYGRNWVRDIESLQPAVAASLTDEDRRIQQFTLAVVRAEGRSTAPLVEDLARTMGPANAVAILMVIGRYVTHALLVGALALDPPVPSIFEDGFSGD
jgi:alkylhydroperoxidase family enzyme